MRTYRYHPDPCESCHRQATDEDRGPALWVTDAKPFDFGGAVGIIESNPGEPKLCDDCELQRRTTDAR